MYVSFFGARFGLKIGSANSGNSGGEKHETEKSEKSLVHPALAIEEDDDGKCEKKVKTNCN